MNIPFNKHEKVLVFIPLLKKCQNINTKKMLSQSHLWSSLHQYIKFGFRQTKTLHISTYNLSNDLFNDLTSFLFITLKIPFLFLYHENHTIFFFFYKLMFLFPRSYHSWSTRILHINIINIFQRKMCFIHKYFSHLMFIGTYLEVAVL